MMRWHVTLPEGKQLWLESDTPHEDLEKMGYPEYALTDARLFSQKELPDETQWVTLRQKAGIESDQPEAEVMDAYGCSGVMSWRLTAGESPEGEAGVMAREKLRRKNGCRLRCRTRARSGGVGIIPT